MKTIVFNNYFVSIDEFNIHGKVCYFKFHTPAPLTVVYTHRRQLTVNILRREDGDAHYNCKCVGDHQLLSKTSVS